MLLLIISLHHSGFFEKGSFFLRLSLSWRIHSALAVPSAPTAVSHQSLPLSNPGALDGLRDRTFDPVLSIVCYYFTTHRACPVGKRTPEVENPRGGDFLYYRIVMWSRNKIKNASTSLNVISWNWLPEMICLVHQSLRMQRDFCIKNRTTLIRRPKD